MTASSSTVCLCASLLSVHTFRCRRRDTGSYKNRERPQRAEAGRFLLGHISQCPRGSLTDPVSLSRGGCLGNVGPLTRVRGDVRRPRNQVQIQPSRQPGSRNTFDALIDLRGTVPGRSPPEALCLAPGEVGEALTGCVLHALLTLFLIFTFWPCLMACGIFVS